MWTDLVPKRPTALSIVTSPGQDISCLKSISSRTITAASAPPRTNAPAASISSVRPASNSTA